MSYLSIEYVVMFAVIAAMVGIVSVYLNSGNARRQQAASDVNHGKLLGAIDKSLVHIEAGICEIRIDTKEIRAEISQQRDRITRVEGRVDNVEKAITEIKGRRRDDPSGQVSGWGG